MFNSNIKRKKTWGKPKAMKKYRRTSKKDIKDNVVYLKRHVILGTISTTVTLGWQAFPYSFRLDTIPNYSELQSVFDQYKVNGIKLQFTPYWDGNDYATQGTNNFSVLPRVYTLTDENGIPAGSINTEAKFLEYSNAKQIIEPQKPFSIYFRPNIEMSSAGDSNTQAAVTSNGPRWIDTSNPTIPHNSCAIGMIVPTGLTGGQSWVYHVVATYYLQFKNAQ